MADENRGRCRVLLPSPDEDRIGLYFHLVVVGHAHIDQGYRPIEHEVGGRGIRDGDIQERACLLGKGLAHRPYPPKESKRVAKISHDVYVR
ncbi:hypothetical protein [Rufibacter tibetensis]|uniref:hypothetical protein n=1 Tax=Rufibacter tibetensis TaxID=512763 RepID=UPI001FDF7365|nr:hypothetical protein [Rufibacter tibetensis]